MARPSGTVSATKSNSIRQQNHVVEGTSSIWLEAGKTYVLINTDLKVVDRFIVSAEGISVKKDQDIGRLCLDIDSFMPNGPAPTTLHTGNATTAKFATISEVLEWNFFLLCINDKTLVRSYRSLNGPSTQRWKDVRAVLPIIMGWTTSQPNT